MIKIIRRSHRDITRLLFTQKRETKKKDGEDGYE
tara:strand:- start:470 stop:571 length:102 start_codon:yes stop_codon:yes gene_type:complete